MKKNEYDDALKALQALAAAQPNLLSSFNHSERGGHGLAQFVWGFVDEFNRQFKEKVKEDALKL